MQEIEAKFYVKDLKRIKTQLEGLGAELIQARVLETNIRFDLPDRGLSSESRVLRLRQDTEARLTYKSAGTKEQGVSNRTEIEFVVEDFERAKNFLEALGYRKLLQYDKYRTTYILDSTSLLVNPQQQAVGLQSCHIMLDELPYGNFVEIEGETIDAIHTIAHTLKLNLNRSITASYSNLFEKARQALGFTFTDLTFANFEDIRVLPEQLTVRPADQADSQNA